MPGVATDRILAGVQKAKLKMTAKSIHAFLHRFLIGVGILMMVLVVGIGLTPQLVSFLHKLGFPIVIVRERLIVGEYPDLDRIHYARYRFALPYCKGKSVADIASGPGYGTKMLRTVAKSVSGYDREALGQQYIIDLERQAWTKHYDAIVSLETIEHLANPRFFVQNLARTTDLLILSTPLNQRPGTNPYHKQVWTYDTLTNLLEPYFSCEYFGQQGEAIRPWPAPATTSFLAVCRTKR